MAKAEETIKHDMDTANCNNTTFKTEIQQEDMVKSALRLDPEHSGRGYSYHCSICNISMANLKAVLDHRKLVHNTTKSKVKHFDLEPDIDDPNHYCIHALTQTGQRKGVLEPVIDDPNYQPHRRIAQSWISTYKYQRNTGPADVKDDDDYDDYDDNDDDNDDELEQDIDKAAYDQIINIRAFRSKNASNIKVRK
ncbi:hypothetical protein HMPREF1544_00386 [Mucor circinelloides 1006PhL]|uniref:C2H2-type domain-containing protein n=1 Tax=Mucor circinelloides f. circinelloides (strain 1006PhL) TaxID=1220926 RepID=S2JW38_MUCC1|nr:hypothetical protein HMPREF1544_00386 [Mucor circinelloides 1006PhL]